MSTSSLQEYTRQAAKDFNNYLFNRKKGSAPRKLKSWTSDRAPSLGGETEKLSKDALCERLQHHASLRIQLLSVIASVYEACKLSVKVERLSTTHQIGSSGNKAYQAAHACLTPRLGCNSRDRLIARIESEGLSELDEKILRAKGALDTHISAIKSKRDLTVEIKKFWKENSLFSGTLFERGQMAVCHQLPAYVNQYVDLPIEKEVRPIAVEMYQEVSSGKYSAFDGLKKVSVQIQETFKRLTEGAQERLEALKAYKQARLDFHNKVNQLKGKETLTGKDQQELIAILSSWRKATIETQKPILGISPIPMKKQMGSYGKLLDLEILNLNETKLREILGHYQDQASFEHLSSDLEEVKEWYKNKRNAFYIQEKHSKFSEDTYALVFGNKDGSKDELKVMNASERLEVALHALKPYGAARSDSSLEKKKNAKDKEFFDSRKVAIDDSLRKITKITKEADAVHQRLKKSAFSHQVKEEELKLREFVKDAIFHLNNATNRSKSLKRCSHLPEHKLLEKHIENAFISVDSLLHSYEDSALYMKTHNGQFLRTQALEVPPPPSSKKPLHFYKLEGIKNPKHPLDKKIFDFKQRKNDVLASLKKLGILVN